MSKKGVLCKFFAHGACLKGEHCEFSHDWKDPSNNICTFYQRGACAYGSRCRYEHVKVSRSQPSSSSSPSIKYPSECILSDSVPAARPTEAALGVVGHIPGVNSEVSAINGSFLSLGKPVWDENSGDDDVSEFSGIGESRSQNPADHPICSFAAAGNCPRGETCPHIHGDRCPTCGKQCLHPFRPQEREDHMTTCVQRQKHLEALKKSQEIECSVCLERVLSNPIAAERKFGILSECDHPFCISCIRNWRSSSPSSGNSALRACPICRKLSYFVIPSVIWYSTREEKEEIVDSYKGKLRSIDCKHFDFGNGTCPFGTSCFYKHTVKPGSYLWNATLMPHLYNSSSSDVDEAEYSSDEENNDALLELFDHFYGPDVPIGVEVDDTSYEDLDDEHAFRDGRLEEVVLRHIGNEDGQTVIAKDIRLSDFLSNLQIR